MADKLILNADLNYKTAGFSPEKCTVEKVIEVSEAEFKRLYEKPMKPNHYLSTYKNLMGFYDESYHCVLFVNAQNGDGLLVNSEGADYARYSQYIPNAREIIRQHEQTVAFGDLIKHIDDCVDKWLEQHANEEQFEISLTDIADESNVAETLMDYVLDRLCSDPRVGDCDLTPNTLEITKRELVETRLYCPLKFEMASDDGIGSPFEVDSANYIDYDYEINQKIREDINFDENAVERGLAAYFHDENLDKKVHSAVPRVETRNGDIYGVITVKSYGELDKTERIDLTNELTGQLADGWGEGFEQREIRLDGDELYISFWRSGDDYFLKPESQVFPEQDINLNMGGIS
ncbi:MAG: hypothetical protein HDR72_01155 [Ruminococcaceae bacterium]|nr:hypothetical protein [Oscillospiraceae bacterium]